MYNCKYCPHMMIYNDNVDIFSFKLRGNLIWCTIFLRCHLFFGWLLVDVYGFDLQVIFLFNVSYFIRVYKWIYLKVVSNSGLWIHLRRCFCFVCHSWRPSSFKMKWTFELYALSNYDVAVTTDSISWPNGVIPSERIELHAFAATQVFFWR